MLVGCSLDGKENRQSGPARDLPFSGEGEILILPPGPSDTDRLPKATATQMTPLPATQTSEPTKEPTPLPTISYFGEETIGSSVAGRPIQVFRFGSGKKMRLIVAGIHGGYEWNTVKLADALIEQLKENPLLLPPGITLYILPVLNPDGYERHWGEHGRLNENGVDLNRNFDALWSTTWKTTNCWSRLPVSPGPGPESEPEVRALVDFLHSHPEIDALISYHSAALGIFPGGQPPDQKSIALAQTIAAVSPYTYPPYEWGCQYTGQLIDWASALDIAALDVELSNHRDLDLEINLRILQSFLGWSP